MKYKSPVGTTVSFLKTNKTIMATTFFTFMAIFGNTFSAYAKQSTNTNNWGYTGLINMPTADVAPMGEFYISGNYFFRDKNFTGNAQMGVFDRLEVGLLGGFPAVSFTGLGANIKYQLIRPSEKNPTALSAGISLLGLGQVGSDKTKPLITGNNLYMVLSHDFNWKISENKLYNLFSGHVGFGGNIDGARIMFGLDIPVTDFVNLEAEYLGKAASFDEMINFGMKVRPFSFLTASLFTIGTTTKGFANTDIVFGISFNSKIPAFQTVASSDDNKQNNQTKISEKIKPAPVEISSPKPEATPKPQPEIKKTPVPVIPEEKIVSAPSTAPSLKPEATPKPQLEIKSPSLVETPAPATVKKEENGSLKGKVSGGPGKSLPEKVILVLKSLKGSFNDKAVTDIDGNYRFFKIPNGEYILIVQKDGFQESRRDVFIKSGEITESNIELIHINGSLSGKITDSNGNPVPDLILTVDKVKKTITDKDGKYVFPELTSGFHLMSVYQNNKEIKSVELDIIAGTELKREITLDTVHKKETNITKTNKDKNTGDVVKKASLIVGKISSENLPLKTARIMFEGDKITVMTVSDQDGKYLVKNLPAGSYKMTVSKSGYLNRIFSVKISEGQEAKLDISLKPEKSIVR